MLTLNLPRRAPCGVAIAMMVALVPFANLSEARRDYNWVGDPGVELNYLDRANWNPGNGPPGADDGAFIGNGGIAAWDDAGSYTIFELRAGWEGAGTVRIRGGGTFTNTDSLWVGADTGVGNEGTLTLSGSGTLLENVGTGTTVIGGFADNSTGTMNVNTGTTFTHSADGLFQIGVETGTVGTMNLDGGTVNHTGSDFMIVGDLGGSGTFNHNSGTLNVSGNQLWISSGAGSTGTYNLSGGDVNYSSDWLQIGIWGGDGTLEVTGGTLTKTGTGGNVRVGAFLGTNNRGTINQSGGLIDIQAGDVKVGVGENGAVGTINLSAAAEMNTHSGLIDLGVQAGAEGTLNLNGGTLTTAQLTGGGGTSSVYFDGGQLITSGEHAEFIAALDNANVKEGGMNIDTNGFAIGTAQNFSGTGAVNVTGGGSLELNGTLADVSGVHVTGATTIEGTGSIGGLVTTDQDSTLAPGSGIGTLDTGSAEIPGTFQVEFDGDQIDLLNVNGLLDLTGGTISFAQIGDALSGASIFATYVSLDGFENVELLNVPDGFEVVAGYEGDNLALVPEPATCAAIFGALALAGTVYFRRRRNG